MRIPAKLISLLFHPLLLPTYAFAIIMLSHPYLFGDIGDGYFSKNMVIVFVNTFCFPTLAILLMRRLGLVKSLEMPEGRERVIPMMTTGVFYVFAFMVFRKGINAPPILSTVLLGAALTTFVCFFINIFTKVSIHAAGMGSLLAVLMFATFTADINLAPVIAATILVAGMVGASRLYLGAHKNGELYYGYLTGFICQLVAFMFSYSR